MHSLINIWIELLDQIVEFHYIVAFKRELDLYIKQTIAGLCGKGVVGTNHIALTFVTTNTNGHNQSTCATLIL